MAKIKFYLDNGVNCQCTKVSGIIDTELEWGLQEGEWESMSDEEKYGMARDWADDYIEVWYEEFDI